MLPYSAKQRCKQEMNNWSVVNESQIILHRITYHKTVEHTIFVGPTDKTSQFSGLDVAFEERERERNQKLQKRMEMLTLN